eukprot:12916376-Prorocentrum_lima.AAC.1
MVSHTRSRTHIVCSANCNLDWSGPEMATASLLLEANPSTQEGETKWPHFKFAESGSKKRGWASASSSWQSC